MNREKISFLLVNYNMNGLIKHCLDSILKTIPKHLAYEILIADNSTNPDFSIDDKLLKQYANITLVRILDNKGWVDALNHLFAKVTGKYAFILHPDIEFKENAIDLLIDFMDCHPSVGIASPNMSYPNGSLNKIRLKFPTLKTETKRILNISFYLLFKHKLLLDEVLWDRKTDISTDTVMSVCMCIRKEILGKVIKIPSAFKIYYANDYLCYIAKTMKFKCYYLKSALVVHFERYADDKKYCSKEEMNYKKSGLAALLRMEKDKFTFLRVVYSKMLIILFKILAFFEFLIHLIVAFLKYRSLSNVEVKEYLRYLMGIPGL